MIGSTTPPNVPVPSGFAASNHSEKRVLENGCNEDDIEQHIYRPPNPFDESIDSEPDQSPPSYQIKTGSKRGSLGNHRYSSEESLEPTMLSVIPEESTLEVQMAESHDLLQQSHNLLKQSHDLLQKSHDSQVKPNDQKSQAAKASSSQSPADEMPWYHDTSQDDWQTTPAYHREEPVELEDGTAKRDKRPEVNKLVVTEELKPVLQVSVSVFLVIA
jgi:hypothetical protein